MSSAPASKHGLPPRPGAGSPWKSQGLSPVNTLFKTGGLGFLLLLGFMFLVLGPLHAVSPSIEYRIKAVALLNFAKFTEWPPGAYPKSGNPFIVGIKGDDPFGTSLTEALHGETINGHSITARASKADDLAPNCHLLFIGRSEASRLGAILRSIEGRPILTVSDIEDFTAQGGMIQFVLHDHRVRFDINPSAANRSSLKLSSKLLSVARRITDN